MLGECIQVSVLEVQFKGLRFARLCRQLRQRDPDAMAGYSICIYKVNAGELHMALYGNPGFLDWEKN